MVLHTNDVHGAISGYAKVAALKKAYEAEGAYVLLMDAGDFCQGDPTVSVSQGKTAVELMNMAGYDVTTLGNHEFDYGYDNLVNLSKEAKFPIVAANVLYQGKVAFNSNQIFTTPSGVKIGVFGLETPETATKAHPAKIKGVTILGDKSMFDCAQAQVDSLKADGCDYIICLGHLGIDKESIGNRSTDLLNVVDGIDVFIDGHSHSTMKDIAEVTDKDGKVNGTLLTSTGTKLASVGVVTISPKGKVTAMSAPTEGMTAEDKDVAARAAAIQKEIDDDYGTVFAKTKVELDGVKANVRTHETNLGDLITDALVWGAGKNGTKVDAAVTNGGGIRATIKKGDITKKDINTVLPFGNTLSIVARSCWRLWRLRPTARRIPSAASPRSAASSTPLTAPRPMTRAMCMKAPPTTHPRPSAVLRSSPLAARPSTSERSTPSLPMTFWLPAAIPITPSRPLPSTTIWVSPWTRS